MRSSCGAVVGLAVSTAVSPAALNDRSRHGGDPGIGLQGVVDAVHGRLVGGSRDLDDDLDRAVEAGAEPVGELVEGDALGRVGGGVAVVGHADPHAQRRDGDGRTGRRGRRRRSARGGCPTWCAHRPETVASAGLATWVLRWIDSLSIFVPARPSRPGSSVTAATIETVTTSATAAPMRADGREPGEEQAEDGDDDGGAGEQHGLAGGGVGGAGGVLDAHAVVEVLAVPGDDEQRVVDAHAEADHGAEDQRELRARP